MIKVKDALIRFLLRYPWLNIAVVAAVTAWFGYFALGVKSDTSLSAFIIQDDPDMAYYNRIRNLFQTDEVVIVAFEARDLFSREDLSVVERISSRLEAVKYVRNVRSLTNDNLITATPDVFEVRALVETMPETKEDEKKLGREATTNYLYVKDIASTDGRFGSLMIDIENVPGEQPTMEVMTELRKILAEESELTGLRFYLVGDALINHSLGEYMQRDLVVTLVPLYLSLIVLLFFTVRKLRDLPISLVTVVLSLGWTVGTIAVLDKPLNNVTIGLVPLVLCIALEDIYYLHSTFYERLRVGGDVRKAFSEALARIIAPCFFTSLTTVIGFATLMSNNVKPILDFGILGSISVVLAFLVSVMLIPSVHILLGAPKNLDAKRRWRISLARPVGLLADTVTKRNRVYWTVLPALLIAAGIGISLIRIETDHLTFFHESSEVYQGTTFVEKHIAGASNIEVIVETGTPDAMKCPENLREVEKLTAYLRTCPRVDKAMSVVDFMKDMNRAMHDNDETYYRLPDDRNTIAQYLLIYSMSDRRNDVEKDFVDYPYSLARIRCRMSEHNSTRILALIKDIKRYAAANIRPDLDVKITAYPVVYSNVVDSLARGQVKSLGLTFLGLLIATSLYFRSTKIGFIAMIPNVIPILVTFGMMGFLGISLNVGTAMTAAIAIGLAMDDTTHFFARFREELARSRSHGAAVRDTLRAIGEPMIHSSILMTAGYLSIALSQFRLSVLFGLLCANTIVVALLSDLFVTPWVLLTFRKAFVPARKRLTGQEACRTSTQTETEHDEYEHIGIQFRHRRRIADPEAGAGRRKRLAGIFDLQKTP